MVRRLRAGGGSTWLAIIGQRKVGKTSLLLETQRREGGAFVLLDLYERTPTDLEIFRTYALRTLDALLSPADGRSLEVAARGSGYAAVLAAALPEIPADSRDFLFELPTADLSHEVILQCLELPENLAKVLDTTVVCAWDEFQEVLTTRKSGGYDLVATMRSVWQRHERVAYVISGSEPSMLRELVASRHSPFFQHFDVFELGPMGRDDALELLLSASEGEFPLATAEAIYSLLGGHPFYLQVVGEELHRDGPPFDSAALKAATQRTLFSRTGRLALFFERVFSQIVGRSSYAAAVLAGLARSPTRLTDLAKSIGAPSGDTARYLQRLGDAVVKRPDGLYELADPVFGLWVRWRSPGGSVVPMTVLGDDGERRVAEALAMMGFDLVYQSRASRGAFDLLATRGPRQLGVQVKRRALPLVFSLDEWHRMESEAARFRWAWVVAADDGERVRFLDPGAARVRKTARVHPEAAIDNLLLWLDAR